MKMRTSRDHQYRQWTHNIATLWKAKIPNLRTLNDRLQGAVLVAFDTEGCSFDPSTKRNSELGFVALCTDIATSKLSYLSKVFSEDNDTRQLTIQLQDRVNCKLEQTSGRIVYAQLADVEELVRDFLSNLPGRCILVGYDLKRELQWIAETLPSLAGFFVAWVDVQELVYHRCIESSPTLRVSEQIGLHTALQAMGFSAPLSKPSGTRAVNDCCRLLHVLAGLFQSVPFSHPGPRIPRFSIYESLPRPDKERSPFALRITPSDGRRLPPRSPREVVNVFKQYEGLRAVGLNWQCERVRGEGVRLWWLSFSTQRALNVFLGSIHEIDFEDITLCAILDFPAEDV